MLFAVLASNGVEGGEQKNWLTYWILQVTLGPLTGIVVGLGGGYLLKLSRNAGWLSDHFQQLSGVALAVIAWSGALAIGGNGFIAAFVAGMAISVYSDCISEAMRDFGETEGQLLSLTTFLLFGAVLVVPAVEAFTIECVIYAVLSLTVIRMIPVVLSLLGAGLSKPTFWFLSWFGPRGLASLLFGLLVVGEFEFQHGDMILSFVVATVLLSMFAHGITAVPGANLYARQLERVDDPIEHSPYDDEEQHRDKFKSEDS